MTVAVTITGLLLLSIVNSSAAAFCDDSGPCTNGGVCVDGFYCECPQGFTADDCSDNDDCEGVVCENGGTCSDFVGGYNCSCVMGFEGQNCEIEITTPVPTVTTTANSATTAAATESTTPMAAATTTVKSPTTAVTAESCVALNADNMAQADTCPSAGHVVSRITKIVLSAAEVEWISMTCVDELGLSGDALAIMYPANGEVTHELTITSGDYCSYYDLEFGFVSGAPGEWHIQGTETEACVKEECQCHLVWCELTA